MFFLAICEKKFSFEQAKELDRLNERRPNIKDYSSSSNTSACSAATATNSTQAACNSNAPINTSDSNAAISNSNTPNPSIQINNLANTREETTKIKECNEAAMSNSIDQTDKEVKETSNVITSESSSSSAKQDESSPSHATDKNINEASTNQEDNFLKCKAT